MKLKQIVDEVFGDYKEAGMLLIFPECSWKCEGCQNKHLALLETKEFPNEEIVKRFEKNPFTKCIIFGGLEPFYNESSIDDISMFISHLIEAYPTKEDRPMLIVYTGYEMNELGNILSKYAFDALFPLYGNGIIKCGRYIQDSSPYFNDILGVKLASLNQSAIDFRKCRFIRKKFNMPEVIQNITANPDDNCNPS